MDNINTFFNLGCVDTHYDKIYPFPDYLHKFIMNLYCQCAKFVINLCK